MAKLTLTPEEAADRISELCVFRWYTTCQGEHDMLSTDGMDALHEAIAAILLEELGSRMVR